jgi:hypothetical protein
MPTTQTPDEPLPSERELRLIEELRRSEAFLLEAQSMSRTGSWHHDLVTGELTVSPEVLRMRGVPADLKPGTIEFFYKNMHPDDQSRVRETYEAAATRRPPPTIASCFRRHSVHAHRRHPSSTLRARS